jgi:hypothetical protein
MLDRLKYNFWLIVFIGNTLVFLYFLYLSFSFTSVYSFRWVFFMSVPFFTSGIHLLIKARSAAAEWLSIINFLLTATLAIYYNANPNLLEATWIFYTTPIFNQLFINAFDVIWSNKYRFRILGVSLTSLLYVFTMVSIFSHFQAFDSWILPLTGACAIGLTILILLPQKKQVTFEIKIDQTPSDEDENNPNPQSNQS